MADVVASKMSQASAAVAEKQTPKKGDRFRCRQCGMEIQVTADCRCHDDEHAHFHCCGQELTRV
jgi:hypothetical protein